MAKMSAFDEGLEALFMTKEALASSRLESLLLFYGPPGSGKTHLAMTASLNSELSPVLYVDNEDSTTGIIDKFDSDKVKILRPRDIFIDPEDVEGTELDVYPTTLDLLQRIADGEETRFKTVVIDPADVLFNWGLSYHEAHNPTDGFAKWTNVHSDLTESPSSQHVGLFQRLKESGVLVILVVHVKDVADGETSFSDFQWAGKGKSILGGIPDFIGYVTRDTKASGVATTTVTTSPTKKNHAKSRYDLPFKMDDPTVGEIIGLTPIVKKTSKEKDAK
jgi:hypothetical protein